MSETPTTDQQHPDWTQAHITVDKNVIDVVENILLECGALAVTFSETEQSDELWEPEPGTNPLWHITKVTGLFQTPNLSPEQRNTLRSKLAEQLILNIQWEHFSDRPWEREWLKYFQPVLIADRLWICPTDDTQQGKPLLPNDHESIKSNQRLLKLDPGLAFGTGSHPTTRLCLRWLCSTSLEGKTVIDYGCGSGILGIAALLLGAEKVIAIDNDPQALEATKQNAIKNGVQNSIEIGLPNVLKEQHSCCDVMIANILAQPLLQLAPRFSELLSPQGSWAISGLLESQIPMLREKYDALFQVNGQSCDQEWALLNGQQKEV